MYYHGHLPTPFTVQDIYAHDIIVERHAADLLQGGLFLDGCPLRRIEIQRDGTITLGVTPPNLPHGLLTYHFWGFQFWEIIHGKEEEPNKEYVGQIEAELAYIRQITGYRYKEEPYSYHVGGSIEEIEG
jgi:hypothetical protein